MNPLACQIIARGSDSASQFYFSAAVGGGQGFIAATGATRGLYINFKSPFSPLRTLGVYLRGAQQRNASNN